MTRLYSVVTFYNELETIAKGTSNSIIRMYVNFLLLRKMKMKF